MRVILRPLIGAVICAAVLILGTLGADAAIPVAKLRGYVCQRSISPVGRGVAVSAVMRPLKGTRRMALRFELFTRTKTNPVWTAVSAGDLGTWLTPHNATLGQRARDIWIVKKPVNNLGAPATYRFRVTFRWTGAHSRTLGTAIRTSATCNQPELRPDLLVQSIDVRPISGHPHLNLYVATIANRGATAARNFGVQFAPSGRLPQSHPIKLLPAHAKTTVSFKGPLCATMAASPVTVDPDGVVDDYNRTNNTKTVDCSSAVGQQ